MYPKIVSKQSITKLIISLVLLFTALPSYADEGPTYVDRKGFAIKGYDTVAYFTENKAIKGDKKFKHQWNEATWLFASAENLSTFKANPEKYAPQYGGYCAYAIANDSYAGIDPKVFTIRNDKLYLNYNNRVLKRWSKKPKKFISQADKFWPELLKAQKDN
ncbi:MAG: YHS domain-containing (seleno)protein [Arenicella sp.]